jgi:hypothetical protein
LFRGYNNRPNLDPRPRSYVRRHTGRCNRQDAHDGEQGRRERTTRRAVRTEIDNPHGSGPQAILLTISQPPPRALAGEDGLIRQNVLRFAQTPIVHFRSPPLGIGPALMHDDGSSYAQRPDWIISWGIEQGIRTMAMKWTPITFPDALNRWTAAFQVRVRIQKRVSTWKRPVFELSG